MNAIRESLAAFVVVPHARTVRGENEGNVRLGCVLPPAVKAAMKTTLLRRVALIHLSQLSELRPE